MLEDGAYGANPAQGVLYGAATGLAYTGFILVLRAGSGELRRVAGPLFDATCRRGRVRSPAGWSSATPTSCRRGRPTRGSCILALSSQVLGWLLISASLPRLPAALTSLLLTIQPVGSVVLGALLFAEAPSGLQLVGVAAILAGLVMVARVRPPPTEGI